MIKEVVHKAYSFSKAKHEGQFRNFSGLPYFTHPKYVARIISELTESPELTAAAFLHDTLEDTQTTYEELVAEFGIDIANIVKELTNPGQMLPSKKVYLSEKMIGMSDGALTVKLADRYHNILFLESDDVGRKFLLKYTDETDYIASHLKHRLLNKDQEKLFFAIQGILDLLKVRTRNYR